MTRDEIIRRFRELVPKHGELCTTAACTALGVQRGTPRWQAIQVVDPNQPWSAAQYHTGVERYWPGRPGPEAPTPGSVALRQHWRGLRDGRVVPGARGHTVLWFAHPNRYWFGYALHSDAARGARMNDTPIELWDGTPEWVRMPAIDETDENGVGWCRVDNDPHAAGAVR